MKPFLAIVRRTRLKQMWVFVALLLLLTGTAFADKKEKRPKNTGNDIREILGDWEGSMKLAGQQHKIAVHIAVEKNGAPKLTVDSPDQSVYGMEAMRIGYYHAILHFELPKIGAVYEGRVPWGPARIEGIWQSGIDSAQLYLYKVSSDTDSKSAEAAYVPRVTGEYFGDWEGEIDSGARKLRFVLHIRRGRNGTSATVDSPDQYTYGISVPEISNDEKAFRFSIPDLKAKFEGTLDDTATSITGTYTQNGKSTPLILNKS